MRFSVQILRFMLRFFRLPFDIYFYVFKLQKRKKGQNRAF